MAWETQTYTVTIELVDDMLGSVPASKSLYGGYVAARTTKKLKKEGYSDTEIESILKEELDYVHDDETQGLTTFFADKKSPFLRPHQVKGFFKEAARRLKEHGNLKQLRDKVTAYLFVEDTTGGKRIRLPKPDGGKYDVAERPIRCQTPQGERTAIARSEFVEEGTKLSFNVVLLNGVISKELLKELLAYGKYQGLGQWRSGGLGQFKVVSITAA